MLVYRGAAANWWERSPNTGNSTNFCNVTTAGAVNNNNASNANGIALGFCACARLRDQGSTARPKGGT